MQQGYQCRQDQQCAQAGGQQNGRDKYPHRLVGHERCGHQRQETNAKNDGVAGYRPCRLAEHRRHRATPGACLSLGGAGAGQEVDGVVHGEPQTQGAQHGDRHIVVLADDTDQTVDGPDGHSQGNHAQQSPEQRAEQ